MNERMFHLLSPNIHSLLVSLEIESPNFSRAYGCPANDHISQPPFQARYGHVITFWPMECAWKCGVPFMGYALKEKRHVPHFPFSSCQWLEGGCDGDIWNSCLRPWDGWHLLRMAEQQDRSIMLKSTNISHVLKYFLFHKLWGTNLYFFSLSDSSIH